MADFCSLCGYGDINIKELYNDFIKESILGGKLEEIEDDQYLTVNVSGICERCGITHLMVNKDRKLFGNYCGEGVKELGHIDDNSEMVIDSEFYKAKYGAQAKLIDLEVRAMLEEQKFIRGFLTEEEKRFYREDY